MLRFNAKAQAIVFGFILTLIFHYSLVFNLTYPLGIDHGDSFLTNFFFNHFFDTLESGNWSNFSNLPMAYGFKNSLFYSDQPFIQAFVSIPVYIFTLNVITTSNVVVLLTIFLSYLSMFFLAYHWTKNYWAGIIAGVIFAFNPYIAARFPDQIMMFSFQFYPLIFLFAEKTLLNPKSKNGLWLVLFLICQLLSSLYYSTFLLIFLPLFLFFRGRQAGLKWMHLVNPLNILGAVLFFLSASVLGFFYFQVFYNQDSGRDILSAEGYSAWPTDYLFTGRQNIIYGQFSESLKKTALEPIINKSASGNALFLGFSVFILLILSNFLVKREKRPLLNLFWFLLILAVILSFGPKVHLTEEWELPNIYLIIYQIPVFKLIRVVSRFGFVVIFFASLISAFSIEALMKKLKRKTGIYIVIIFLSLILLEYWNKPLNFTYFNGETVEFYKRVESDPNIKVVIDYPVGNTLDSHSESSRPPEYDASYLLLASTLHSKTLFNGYIGFLPEEYFKKTNEISVVFPTPAKLNLLKKWGVDAIILHKDSPLQFEVTGNKLLLVGLKKVDETSTEMLFTLYDWPGQTPAGF